MAKKNVVDIARKKWKNFSKDDLCPICKKEFKDCEHSIVEAKIRLYESYIRKLIER